MYIEWKPKKILHTEGQKKYKKKLAIMIFINCKCSTEGRHMNILNEIRLGT